MFPIVFSRGDFFIPTFYLMMVIASLGGTYVIYYFAAKEGLSRVVALDIGMIGTVTGIIGSRIFHIVIEYPWYYIEHPSYVWQIWRGGLVWYGGMIMAALSVLAYLRLKKLPVVPYLDITALAICIALFFGRIGCFSVGCCYGKPTHLPWGIIFPPSSEAGRQYPGLPVHPTQLYEMTSVALLFVIGVWIERRKTFHGQTMAIIIALYAILRGIVEIFRGDADRGIFFGLSTSQLIGLVNLTAAVMIYRYCRKRYPIVQRSEIPGLPNAFSSPSSQNTHSNPL